MSRRMALVAAMAAGLSLSGSASAGLVTADWSWVGDAGWRAGGVVTWNDTIAFPSASGAGTSAGLRNTGIDYLSVSLYRPTGASAGSWTNINNGVVLGRYVQATIDSAALDFALGSTLRVGDLLFAQQSRMSIVFGTGAGSGAALFLDTRVWDRGPGAVSFVVRQPPPDPKPDPDPDPEPEPKPTPVPVPAPLALVALGLALLGLGKHRAMRQRGVTLVELLVTLAIVSILLILAPPALSWMVGKSAVATTTNELRGALGYARAVATSRPADVTVCAGTRDGCDQFGDWASGWVAFVDANGNGELDSDDELLRVWAAPRGGVEILATTAWVTLDKDGIAWRTQAWAICRDDMEPRRVMMWATGATAMYTPGVCELPTN